MPRPRNRHSRDVSHPVAVRLPLELVERMYRAAGVEFGYTEAGRIAPGGPQLAEWHRNVIRRAVGIPLDKKAGYEEGKMQGWSESQTQMRSALSGFYRGTE